MIKEMTAIVGGGIEVTLVVEGATVVNGTVVGGGDSVADGDVVDASELGRGGR